MFRADLHCHTNCSDGTNTPEELLHQAKRMGLQGLSITDHDTIAAYTIAVPVAQELGIFLGAGVEFSCRFEDQSVHILAYDFVLSSSVMETLCKEQQFNRTKRNQVILEKLHSKRIFIDQEELDSLKGVLGRPHIAQLMIKKGYVNSIQEAFTHYLGDHQPCFYQGELLQIEETIHLIHQAQGKVFLAHPHLLSCSIFIKNLFKLPFDGIECYYAKISSAREKRWIQLAKSKGLLISGGSDYHGSAKSYLPLGCSWVDRDTFFSIFQNLL
ncbi:MAG: PHP domain-containing protein [Chlamydiales bacterium]|jgi:predicted metal-dependent phosphoesterase TrpH|nr:PHP domain-containing protein [Chlamydiales bacterium]